MAKIVGMREMLAGRPVVDGISGIGYYEATGTVESQYSPYDEPGKSARLWRAVGDVLPPPAPPPLVPKTGIDPLAMAKQACKLAGGVWNDQTNLCQPGPTSAQPPAPPPAKPGMSDTTTALVVLGVLGLGAVWAFSGTGKRARS